MSFAEARILGLNDMQEAIAYLEKALEVFSWCQENADEKWMVDHLMAVRKDIDQALSILKQPKAQPISELIETENKSLNYQLECTKNHYKRSKEYAARYINMLMKCFDFDEGEKANLCALAGAETVRRKIEQIKARQDTSEASQKELLDNLKMLVALLCHPGSFVSAKDIEKAEATIAKAETK